MHPHPPIYQSACVYRCYSCLGWLPSIFLPFFFGTPHPTACLFLEKASSFEQQHVTLGGVIQIFGGFGVDMVQDASIMQMLPERKHQLHRWHDQNQFLQDRHGRTKVMSPETILVGSRFSEDGFDLLSWTINVAAGPGDSVIALHVSDPGEKLETRVGGQHIENIHELQTIDPQLQQLKDLCNVKQVHLDVKIIVDESAEKVLIEQASAVKATMIVVSTSGCHVLRNSQKRGSFLVQRAPAGCSVVVVKKFKILFYRENGPKARTERNTSVSHDDLHNSNKMEIFNGVGQRIGSLQKNCSQKPSIARAVDADFGFDSENSTGFKILQDQIGNCSPRGVLEGPGISSESDGSSTCSNYGGLTPSLSRRALLSSASFYEDGDAVYGAQPRNCLSLRRHISMQRSSTFPPTSRLRKLYGSFHYSSMRSSLKSYLNAFLGIEGGDQVSACSEPTEGDVKQLWRCFTYEELLLATNGFDQDNMVGKGGYAEVFKGSLPNGQLIAVKRLIKVGTEEQKENDFLTELGILGHVSHPNTTPLLGFCIEKGLYLIFHFLLHGSLASHLHGANTPVLEWAIRYKVAAGTARGLHYLHTDCQRRIIHRDIKASNILLGQDFEPQISDFGLAKWLPENWTHHTVAPIEGTFGYLAPEYFMHGVVDEKTDVFAFGVLLLELITGRQPIDDSSQQSLVMWARPLLESLNIDKLVDPRLGGAYNAQEIQCIVMAAGLCVQQSSVCRPCMSQVLQLLTEEGLSSDTSDSWSIVSSQSNYLQDGSCDEEYSSRDYLSDMNRHREVALQF